MTPGADALPVDGATHRTGDEDGLRLAASARALHPTARRAVAVPWGGFERAGSVFDAVGSGAVDFYLLQPRHRRDEEFHRTLTEGLEEWAAGRSAGFEPVQIVGERWSARTAQLRDTFARTMSRSGSTAPTTRACGSSTTSGSTSRPCPPSSSGSPRGPSRSATRPTCRSPRRSVLWAATTRTARSTS